MANLKAQNKTVLASPEALKLSKTVQKVGMIAGLASLCCGILMIVAIYQGAQISKLEER